jgi:hypothetical protein
MLVAQTKYYKVPPIWDRLIYGHEAGVDIRLFGERATSLSPHLFVVVEEGVGERGCDGCKREPVENSEGRGNEGGAVGLVSLEVKGEIGIDDPRDVVFLSRVIERV